MKQVNRKHNRTFYGAMPLEDKYKKEDVEILKIFWEHLYEVYKIFNTPVDTSKELLPNLYFTPDELAKTTNSMLSLAKYGKHLLGTRLNVYSLIDDIACFRNKYTANQHPISELFNYSTERCFEFLKKLDILLRRNGGSYNFPFYFNDTETFKKFMLFEVPDKTNLINKDYDFYPTYSRTFERAFFNITYCIFHMLQLQEVDTTIPASEELKAILGPNIDSFKNLLLELLNTHDLYLGVYYENYDYGLEGDYEFQVKHDHDNEW